MEEKRSGRLNFKASLLSTRRPSSYLEEHATSASINRVPFSWEQAPGKPNECSGTSDQEAAITPRPKPPPGRWKPPPNHEDDEDESGKDILSLTEAIDMVQDDQQKEASTASSSDHTASSSNLDRLSLQNSTTMGEVNDDGADSATPSPNFMMERFLPDAAALTAATSALNLSKQVLNNHYPETQPPVVAESTKAYGLEMLLPWRIRHRLAGVNNTLVHQQPKSSINAKHKRRFSSLHLPSPDWTCK